MVDRPTKMCRLIPCDFHCLAQEVAHIFSTEVFSIFGLPDSFISDQDPRFTAQWFRAWAKMYWHHAMLVVPLPSLHKETGYSFRVGEQVLNEECGIENYNLQNAIAQVAWTLHGHPRHNLCCL